MGEKNGKRALLIVDMTPRCVYGPGGQEVSPDDGAASIIPFIQGELDYFRVDGRPVIFCVPPGETVVEALHPRVGETVIEHPQANIFFGTDLEKTLRSLGVKRVTLVGTGAAQAILLSAGDALAHGFGLSVPEPCVHDEAAAKAFALSLMFERWAAEAAAEA